MLSRTERKRFERAYHRACHTELCCKRKAPRPGRCITGTEGERHPRRNWQGRLARFAREAEVGELIRMQREAAELRCECQP